MIKEAYMAGFSSAQESAKATTIPQHIPPIPVQNQLSGQNWVDNAWSKKDRYKQPGFMKNLKKTTLNLLK